MIDLVASYQVELDKRLSPQSHRGHREKEELLILSVSSVARENEVNGWWVSCYKER